MRKDVAGEKGCLQTIGGGEVAVFERELRYSSGGGLTDLGEGITETFRNYQNQVLLLGRVSAKGERFFQR